MLSRVCRVFSTLKVPIESIKRLREETSAPMGECKKALQESNCDYEGAVRWLKQKGLLTSEKRADKETREGVIASFISPCRRKAVMVEVNCETDFVARSEFFVKFIDILGNRFLDSEEPIDVENLPQEKTKNKFTEILERTEPANIFPEDKEVKNMGEELKLLISRLQENIRIRRAITLHSDGCRYGYYVHRPYSERVGLQACVVQLATDPQVQDQEANEIIDEFADDMATQILGSPPKYLNFDQIPEDQIAVETEKARTEMAGRLEKAPEHTHEGIIAGKLLSNYYSKVLLGCMPYLLSNEGIQVSQQWNNVEHQTGLQLGNANDINMPSSSIYKYSPQIRYFRVVYKEFLRPYYLQQDTYSLKY